MTINEFELNNESVYEGEGATSVVAVLEGTPTGRVLYNGRYRSIPKTRLDTFVSLYLRLLEEGGMPLGVVTGYKQSGAILHYITSELLEYGVPKDEIKLCPVEETEITIDDAVKTKKFLLKKGLDKLPFFLVTSEEHMRTVACKDFDVCFGDDILFRAVPAPWGVNGLGRIKAELHGVVGNLLDSLIGFNVERGDHEKLAWKRDMFWPLREWMMPVQKLESIGREKLETGVNL